MGVENVHPPERDGRVEMKEAGMWSRLVCAVWSKAKLSPMLVLLFVQPGCCPREPDGHRAERSQQLSANAPGLDCCDVAKE